MPCFVAGLVDPVILGDLALVGACQTPGCECAVVGVVFVVFAVSARVIVADSAFVDVYVADFAEFAAGLVDFASFAGFVTVGRVSRQWSPRGSHWRAPVALW